jgi:hypothetical protein
MITLSPARALELVLLRNGQRRQNPEYELQCAFVHWLDTVAIPKWPELAVGFSIPNERASKGQAVKLWRAGARSGPADWFLPLPHGGYSAFAMEFKAPKGAVKKTQQAWHLCVGGAGVWMPHQPVRDLEDAQEHVTGYLQMHPRYDVEEVRAHAQALLDARAAATQKRKRQRRRR